MFLVSGEYEVLFRAFRDSAFRLEVYQARREVVGDWAPDGRSVVRVKVLGRPLTDCGRATMDRYVAAGEECRVIEVAEGGVELPNQDFWLFDESVVVHLNYRLDGVLLSRELIREPDLERYLRWRDIAVKESVAWV